jgi:hypothetical protein
MKEFWDTDCRAYAIDSDKGLGYDLGKEWYIGYSIPKDSPKILEDDTVTFYGEFKGTKSIKRALTSTTEEVPYLEAKYFKIKSGSSEKHTV